MVFPRKGMLRPFAILNHIAKPFRFFACVITLFPRLVSRIECADAIGIGLAVIAEGVVSYAAGVGEFAGEALVFGEGFGEFSSEAFVGLVCFD